MTLYKTLLEDGSTIYGYGAWEIPNGKPSPWMPEVKGVLVECKNGYHAYRTQDLIEHVGPVICELEYDGELVECADKVIVRRARLIKSTAWTREKMVLWAADCAERVLHIFEDKCPADNRPRTAIEEARIDAAGDAWAAKDATRNVAWAAWAAAWAAGAARDAARAAFWAAGDAARDARDARSAAWAAAWAAGGAEREWQVERLCELAGIER